MRVLRVVAGGLLWLPILAVGGIAALILPFILLSLPAGLRDLAFQRRVSRVRVGQSERSVRDVMDVPHSIYTRAEFGTAFPLEGVVWDGWKVSGKVLVYRGARSRLAYIYLDDSGQVEHVALVTDMHAD